MQTDDVVREPMTERRAMVRRQRRRRRIRIAALALVTAGAAGGTWYLNTSAVFAIDTIEVRGVRLVDEDVVRRVSGLAVGENALTADLETAAARIERLPVVRDAAVERLGSLGVLITVTERVPAMVAEDDADRWVLDRHGVVLDLNAETDGLPVVDLVRTMRPRDGVLIEPGIARNLARLIERVGGPKAGPYLLHPDGEVEFRWRGTDVRFGLPDRIAEKMRALKMVRERVRADGDRALVVDVSVPTRPAARVR